MLTYVDDDYLPNGRFANGTCVVEVDMNRTGIAGSAMPNYCENPTLACQTKFREEITSQKGKYCFYYVYPPLRDLQRYDRCEIDCRFTPPLIASKDVTSVLPSTTTLTATTTSIAITTATTLLTSMTMKNPMTAALSTTTTPNTSLPTTTSVTLLTPESRQATTKSSEASVTRVTTMSTIPSLNSILSAITTIADSALFSTGRLDGLASSSLSAPSSVTTLLLVHSDSDDGDDGDDSVLITAIIAISVIILLLVLAASIFYVLRKRRIRRVPGENDLIEAANFQLPAAVHQQHPMPTQPKNSLQYDQPPQLIQPTTFRYDQNLPARANQYDPPHFPPPLPPPLYESPDMPLT